MKPGDLVELWGQLGVYGIIISPAYTISRWHVLLHSGNIVEKPEVLLEVVSEGR